MVSALDFQAGYRGFESPLSRDNFQTITTSSSFSTYSGLSIKWTRLPFMTDSGTKYAWVIHGSKAVQIHVHNNHLCLYVPQVPGSIKNPHNKHQDPKTESPEFWLNPNPCYKKRLSTLKLLMVVNSNILSFQIQIQ